MCTKIGGNIGEPDSLMIVALSTPKRRRGRGTVVLGPDTRAAQLVALLMRNKGCIERPQRLAPGAQIRENPFRLLLQIAPVAQFEPAPDQIAPCVLERRIGL